MEEQNDFNELVPEGELSEASASEDDSSLIKGETEKPARKSLLGQKQAGERGWYVIHTYTGYEDQVAETLRQRVESLGLSDKVFSVTVPTEKQIEIKNGKRKTVERKIFPGYVLVEMIVTDNSWYVVRNTPNVTGFIGLGVRPTPIPPDEVSKIKKRMGVDEPRYNIDFNINDLVTINDGPLKGFQATVNELDEERGKVKVLVNMFGRETPATLDFLQVKKV
ncbi:transcription termination/antitermination protein NusG [Candidatus Berkelbacteria bacterium]|nr:transcription termination/antitermination protein NusG [Candidatus Berkelbacteria bacterium]